MRNFCVSRKRQDEGAETLVLRLKCCGAVFKSALYVAVRGYYGDILYAFENFRNGYRDAVELCDEAEGA